MPILERMILRLRHFVSGKGEYSGEWISPILPCLPGVLEEEWKAYLTEIRSCAQTPWLKWGSQLFPIEMRFGFLQQVAGKSQLKIGWEYRAHNPWTRFLAGRLGIYFQKWHTAWVSCGEEFLYYRKGSDTWKSFTAFRNLKADWIQPEYFHRDKTLVLTTTLSWEDATTYLPKELHPAPTIPPSEHYLLPTAVPCIHVLSYLRSVGSDLYQIRFESDPLPWIWDVFVLCRTVSPDADSTPQYHYLASRYSHESIAKHCSAFRLKRRLYLGDWKDVWVDADRGSLRTQTGGLYSLDSRKIDLPPQAPGSRFIFP